MAGLGFKILEVGCYVPEFDFNWRNKKSVKELKNICDDNDIIIWSAHPPENDVLLMPDDKARRKHFDLLHEFAEFCNLIGAAYMPIHFWLPISKFREVGKFTCYDEVITELDGFFEKYQIVPCLETLRKNASALGNFELLETIKNKSSNLGMLLDTGHAEISNELNQITLEAKGFIKSLHLHDNDGVNDLHQIPGKGVTDWKQFAESLKTIGYNGPIIFEVRYDSDQEQVQLSLEQIMTFYKKTFGISRTF